MEGEEHGLREGQGGNPADNVNAQLATALTQIAEYFKRQETRAETLETADDVALERFQKFRPPKFNGEANEEVAERWMESMGNIYAALKYTEERKVRFGVFQLEGPAKAWWRVIEQKWEQEGRPHTWNIFLEEFKNKFIPMIVREKKEEEFMYLKQRALTVAQYEILFTKLSKYAPDMVNTETKRKRRFWLGLNVEIQNALVTARMDTYADLVEYAQRIEDSQARLKAFRNSVRVNSKRLENLKEKVPQGQAGPRQTGFERHSRKRPNEASTSMPVRRNKNPAVRCRYCRLTNHTESECWKKMSKCSECGTSEHQIGECPMLRENPKTSS